MDDRMLVKVFSRLDLAFSRFFKDLLLYLVNPAVRFVTLKFDYFQLNIKILIVNILSRHPFEQGRIIPDQIGEFFHTFILLIPRYLFRLIAHFPDNLIK